MSECRRFFLRNKHFIAAGTMFPLGFSGCCACCFYCFVGNFCVTFLFSTVPHLLHERVITHSVSHVTTESVVQSLHSCLHVQAESVNKDDSTNEHKAMVKTIFTNFFMLSSPIFFLQIYCCVTAFFAHAGACAAYDRPTETVGIVARFLQIFAIRFQKISIVGASFY